MGVIYDLGAWGVDKVKRGASPEYNRNAELEDAANAASTKAAEQAAVDSKAQAIPDLGTVAGQAQSIAMQRRRMMGQGLSSSFLTGPLGPVPGGGVRAPSITGS
jgi:hypothetical protein